MGYINPLLRLPAGRALQNLPKSDRKRIEAVMRELRDQANTEAETAWRRRKSPMASYWRAVSTYARHIAHALSSPGIKNTSHTGRAYALTTTAGGRAYIADYFVERMGRHDFSNYINDALAADFACILAQHLADLAPPKPTCVPDDHLPASVTKQDRAALGIPSCGGPLCSESMHHPLCRKRAHNEKPAAELPVGAGELTNEEIVDLAVEPLGIDYDRMPHGVVKFARSLLDRAASRKAGSMLQFLAESGGAIETDCLEGRQIYRVWWPKANKRQYGWYPSPEAAIEEAQHEDKGGEK